jgi:hypothetical protein
LHSTKQVLFDLTMYGSRGTRRWLCLIYSTLVISLNIARAADLDPQLQRILEGKNDKLYLSTLNDEFDEEEWQLEGKIIVRETINIDKEKGMISVTTQRTPFQITAGKRDLVEAQETQVYSMSPPYELISARATRSYREKTGPTKDTIKTDTYTLEKKEDKGNQLVMTSTDSTKEHSEELTIQKHTLKDLLKNELWLQSSPKVGDVLEHEFTLFNSFTKTLSKITKISEENGDKIYDVQQTTATSLVDSHGERQPNDLEQETLRMNQNGKELEIRDYHNDLRKKAIENKAEASKLNEDSKVPEYLSFNAANDRVLLENWNDKSGLYWDVKAKQSLLETSRQKIISQNHDSFFMQLQKGPYTLHGPILPQDIEPTAEEVLPTELADELNVSVKGKSFRQKMIAIDHLSKEHIKMCNGSNPTPVANLNVAEKVKFGIGACSHSLHGLLWAQLLKIAKPKKMNMWSI